MEARNICVRIGDKRLLDDVSLEVRTNEIVACIGANGAGKSTLLKTLCGDVRPTGGEVSINNRSLGAWSHCEVARVRGVLPQESNLSFPFTALEVALMGRTPHTRGRETKRDYEIARAALAATDASHLESRMYPTLSGGERQRVQLARVLAQVWETRSDGARYLLLDEPTSSLDIAHQHATLAVARRFAHEGAGVLVVLHDLNLAAQYADRIVMMKSGRIIAHGKPDEVLTPEGIGAAYGIRVMVMPHPHARCPLIVTLAPRVEEANSNTHASYACASSSIMKLA